MTKNKNKPYQLPHLLDRAHQQDVMDWILNSDKQYLILCAPTGFGKSPLAAAASIDFRVLTLVLHKSLQSANYQDAYSFDILYGKGSYPCIDRNKKKSKLLPQYTAFDCGNPECDCPYQTQLLHCLGSNRVCLNYAKFLMTNDFAEIHKPDYLFLDEAHNMPDVTLDFVGCTLDWDNEFAQTIGKIKPEPSRLNYAEAINIFRQYARAVERNKPDQSPDLKRWRKWKRLHQKLMVTNQIISKGNLEDWYYEANDKTLVIKPLTAKYDFKRLFGKADKIILMSATIKPTIAERLGIEPDEYEYMTVPGAWPIPTRLIYDLKAPAINWKSSEADKQRQAELIAQVLRPDKSGVIHTMSKYQAIELEQRLKSWQDRTGQLQFLTYIPAIGVGTEKQLEQWYQIRRPGTYCISWSFHEGVDLGLDDINIMAKTPYTSIAPGYEEAKKDYDPAWYLEKTAMTMEQLFGRHQRGQAEHYRRGKMAYIADSSWHRIKTHLSADFLGRIRNL